MSEVDLIVVVLESVSERQSIVEAIEPRILSLQCVLVVVGAIVGIVLLLSWKERATR